MSRLVAAIAVICAALTAGAQSVPQPHPAASAVEAIRQADLEWAKTAARRDIEAFMAMVADDAHFVSDGKVEVGKDAIRPGWAKLLADPDTTITWAPEFADAMGDLGYSIGHFEIQGKGKDGPWTVKGIYQTTWRRGADGKWRAIADIGNPAPPEKK